MHAPITMGLTEGDESDAFGRMAKGSAGIAELVYMMRVYPWQVIENFGSYARQHAGVFRNDQVWPLEAIARSHVERMDGHKTLAKMIIILAHAHELMRRNPQSDPFTQAFIGQSFKRAIEALNNRGSWALVWPLLGLTDPDQEATSLTSAPERVAVAAYQKEEAILGPSPRRPHRRAE